MQFTRRKMLWVLAGAPALILPRQSAAQDGFPEIAKGPYDGSVESHAITLKIVGA